ncbi:MAG: hypothetical protein IPJ32_16835 [Sphingobacteriaceae bacterium]|nr:hypothetical protein [Sphingobacteriaceae bacterium]
MNSNEILFALSADNVGYYFTKKGYVIAYAKQIPSVKKKRKKKRRPEDEDEDFEAPKYSYQYHEVEFLNANTKCSIEGLHKQLNYYSYGYTNETENKQTLIAHSYKKIVYKNIYPNTDLLFEFKDDTCGIKYSFILYPGANSDLIRMRFPLAKTIAIDKKNNLSIESEFGPIIEHTPKIIEGTKVTTGDFILKNNLAGFFITHPIITDTTIIDPWVIILNLSPFTADKVLDVDYDNQGNVYAAVYGNLFSAWGVNIYKYNSSGILVWTYGPPFSSNPFGDFAINRRTNDIFFGEGLNTFSGARIVRTNSNAIKPVSFWR